MFIFAAVMLALFLVVESRASEPIIPLSLFKNRIVAVSEIVTFFTGIGMFGGIIFIPLFFQGVLGATATASGSFLTPMMLGMVFGSFISGQLLSRAGGHYRIQGAAGLIIMATGTFLLSRMNAETTYGIAVVNIVVTGVGLGILMPLYTIAVQNAVPYKLLGVATSSTAFFRAIGGSVGLAILGSVMNNRFAGEIMNRLPDEIKSNVPQQQLDAMINNPEALVSPDAQSQLQGLLSHFGQQGSALYDQVIQALHNSLSLALSDVFFIGFIILVIAFIANLFIPEIPLRKKHTPENTSEENIKTGS